MKPFQCSSSTNIEHKKKINLKTRKIFLANPKTAENK
jgi:hypothetical protein